MRRLYGRLIRAASASATSQSTHGAMARLVHAWPQYTALGGRDSWPEAQGATGAAPQPPRLAGVACAELRPRTEPQPQPLAQGPLTHRGHLSETTARPSPLIPLPPLRTRYRPTPSRTACPPPATASCVTAGAPAGVTGPVWDGVCDRARHRVWCGHTTSRTNSTGGSAFSNLHCSISLSSCCDSGIGDGGTRGRGISSTSPGVSSGGGGGDGGPSSSGGGDGSVEVPLSPALEARLRQLHSRCGQLEAVLTGTAADGGGGGGARRDAGREYTRLKPLAAAYERLLQVRQELGDLAALLGDADPRVRAMAQEEGQELRQQAAALTRRLLLALVPRDPRDGRAALLEVRAGAGGQEAALFCGDLLEMYRKFSESRGWSWQVVEVTASEVGGVKHAVVAVSDGKAGAAGGAGGGSGYPDGDGDGNGGAYGVYGTLLPESGVHRVQRVPATETQGRVHTSTAAVVVLPQADEVDVRLRDEDLRIETMRASGAGGQHVNVTDSAVRITHVPTGLVVSCQNERSQHQNRASALKVLRARLYDLEAQKRAREMDEQRSALVTSADRSERVRTYNFPQGRVTDHRIHVTVHDLESVLEGGEGLERLVGALRAAREEEALRRLAEQGQEGGAREGV